MINLTVRLEHRNPRSRIAERLRHDGKSWIKTSGRPGKDRIEQWKNRVRSATALLDSLSPLAVLNRGYSITRRLPDGLILRQAEDVRVGQEVDIRLAAGNLHAKITDILL